MANEAFKQALGQIILQLRIERGISQEKLALDAEVDRTRVGEIERGGANATRKAALAKKVQQPEQLLELVELLDYQFVSPYRGSQVKE
jgi:transcriptional regulator with XRE-family HTH domain